MKPKTTRFVRRIIPFGLIWLVMSLVYLLLEKGIIGDLNYYPGSDNPYDFYLNLRIIPLTALLFGLLFGTLEILVIKKMFSGLSLFSKLLLKSILYFLAIIIFLILTSAVANTVFFSTFEGLRSELIINSIGEFIRSPIFWSITLYIGIMSIIAVFISDLSEHIGQGVLVNFIFGRYHKPLVEDRVFMFLDMESSTAIAEKLGHQRYFDFLKFYFSTMSDAIIEYKGEVYQYAGDEIIVSWALDDGIRGNACIQTFFAIDKAFKENLLDFDRRFSVQPTFKAAFHCGTVTSGEIGEIKKEVLFTGDVLNTTARLQSLCKSLDADVLISESLLLFLDFRKGYSIEDKGVFDLKGKERAVRIFSVKESNT